MVTSGDGGFTSTVAMGNLPLLFKALKGFVSGNDKINIQHVWSQGVHTNNKETWNATVEDTPAS